MEKKFNNYIGGDIRKKSSKKVLESKRKNHVAPPSSQDEALSRYSASGEVPR